MTTNLTKTTTECQVDTCNRRATVRIEDYGLGGDLSGTVDVCLRCVYQLMIAEECGHPDCECASLPSKMKGVSCDH